MNKRRVTSLLGLAALAVLLTRPLPVQSQDEIIVGVSGPSVNMIYAFAARDGGFLRKYGLDARVVLFEAGSVLAQAAISGDVKISISSGPATIASRSQGADTIIVAACVNTLPYSLIAAKGITKWEDLKGKKIAISRFGSGTDTAIRLVLKKFGLDPLKDVTILQMGSQPSRVQALAAGSIDATLVSPPLDLAAKKQGYQILVNIAELGIPYPQQVIETTDRFTRQHPQTVKNFLKGFIEAVRYVAVNKDETKKLITKYLKGAEPDVLEATYQSYLQVTDKTAYPNMQGLRNAMDEVAQRVPAVKEKKPEDFVDTRFLKELEKEGFSTHLNNHPPAKKPPAKGRK
ncbi:MAG: ABC transporter substrate-binding protein [Deltaproteobacteria bacterium]|nr:ABC transporter substrate-binding protein [Deltaproteobacteria bacterium]